MAAVDERELQNGEHDAWLNKPCGVARRPLKTIALTGAPTIAASMRRRDSAILLRQQDDRYGTAGDAR
eukprot:6203684-Pleurochrysis_carterae.AAC.1